MPSHHKHTHRHFYTHFHFTFHHQNETQWSNKSQYEKKWERKRGQQQIYSRKKVRKKIPLVINWNWIFFYIPMMYTSKYDGIWYVFFSSILRIRSIFDYIWMGYNFNFIIRIFLYFFAFCILFIVSFFGLLLILYVPFFTTIYIHVYCPILTHLIIHIISLLNAYTKNLFSGKREIHPQKHAALTSCMKSEWKVSIKIVLYGIIWI